MRGPGLDRRVLLGAVCALAVLTLGWGALRAEAVATEQAVDITGAPGSGALFPGDPLRPGVPRSACLVVSATGAAAADTVRVTALEVSGDLASDLEVVVDTGTGGGGGSCAGFTGSRAWSGTLAALAGTADAGGVDVGWRPAAEASRSFRVTVTLPDRQALQGLTSSGRFAWRVVPGPPPTSPPDAPGPAPTGPTEPTPPGGPTDPSGPTGPTEPTGPTDQAPAPSPTGTATAEPPVLPPPGPGPTAVTPTGTAPAAVATPGPTTAGATPTRDRERPREEPAAGGGAGGGGTPPVPDAPPAAEAPPEADVVLLPELPVTLARTVVALGSDPQYPLAAIAVVLVFLLVQHGIDAGDPKLRAAAARQRDTDLAFADPFAPRGGAGARTADGS